MMKMVFGDGRLGTNESAWHDLVRCLLIVQVVLGHLAAIALLPVPDLVSQGTARAPETVFRLVTRFGPQAAYLFVLLSGVMVGGGLIASMREGAIPSSVAFFRKRMSRILPIAVLAILATGALDLLAIGPLEKAQVYRHAYAYDMVAALTWPTFIGNLLFLQPVITSAFGSNGPLWTLGYIVQFYVVGWILARLWLKSRFMAGSALLAVLVGMSLIKPEWSILFIGWIAGSLARFFPPTAKTRASVFALVLAVCIFIGSNLTPPLISAALSIPVGVLFVLWAKSTSLDIPMKWVAGLRSLSSETYSVYAVHHPTAMFIFALMLGAPAPSAAAFAAYLVVALVGVLAMSAVVSRAGAGVALATETVQRNMTQRDAA